MKSEHDNRLHQPAQVYYQLACKRKDKNRSKLDLFDESGTKIRFRARFRVCALALNIGVLFFRAKRTGRPRKPSSSKRQQQVRQESGTTATVKGMPVPTTDCVAAEASAASSTITGSICNVVKPESGKHEDDVYSYEDSYIRKWGESSGETIPRIGKIFSYTFWRTQLNNDVFWSMQGNDWENCSNGKTIISTQYLGDQRQSRRFIQEVILTHPYQKEMQLTYSTTCQDGLNHIHISKKVINHFKLDDNSFRFQFRIVRIRKKRYPL